MSRPANEEKIYYRVVGFLRLTKISLHAKFFPAPKLSLSYSCDLGLFKYELAFVCMLNLLSKHSESKNLLRNSDIYSVNITNQGQFKGGAEGENALSIFWMLKHSK